MAAALLLLGSWPALAQEAQSLKIQKWKTTAQLYEQIDEAGAPAQVDISNQTIAKKELLELMARYPATEFYYRLRFGNRKLLCDSTEADLGYYEFEGGMDELLEYMKLMPCLTSVTDLGTVFSAEEMERFTTLYPQVKYLFKIRFARYTVRTDITAFCTKHALYTKKRYNENDFAALKYCRELKALDIGHNSATSLEFLRQLPKLQIFICVDNLITDLTPLESQTDLEYLEVFLNPGITDVTPLGKLTKLVDLHISHCGITDITALYGLKKLDRLWLAQNPIPKEQIEHIRQLMPDCTINDTVDVHPTAEGWRQGHPRYLKIRKMFEENRYVQFP